MFFYKIHVRMRCLFLFLIIIFFLIFLKVLYIEVISYKKLTTLSDNLYSRRLPITSDRGLITDRNGKILANNITTTSLYVVPRQIKNKEKVAKDIAYILNVPYERIYKHLNKKTSIEKIHPEGRSLSYKIAKKIDDLNYDGVYLLKESKRYYPYGSMLSHTLGYVGIDNQGLSGLELIYNKYLTGEYGAIKYFSDAKGKKLKLSQIYEQPQSGMNITLTINYDIQQALERELDNAVNMYNPDGTWGIVMDPNTGQILAMSSRPTYSPENYKKYSIEEINRNLPIWMTYEPGSTFKIITLSAALNEKLIDLDKDIYNDSGSVKVSGATIHCWKHGGHGHQTLLEVVENSCNTGFVHIGFKLGKDKLFKYINDFGFGNKTGIELSGEENGIIFNPSKIGDLETATTAFGQGVSVTALQQVTAVSAAVNGGTLYKPYIVKSINEPQTNQVIVSNKPTKIRSVISREASDKVKYALESVVARGTGHNAYIADYRVGGKTGTAQKVKDGVYMQGNYITSFIGIMPANNPEVVVYIAVDNAKGITQYGGTVAAPIARQVMKSIIDILDIKPDKNGIEKEDNYIDKKYVTVPNVVSMDLKKAQKVLKGFTIKKEGKGKVLYQSPEAGNKIEEGSIIRLYLE